MSSSQVLAVQTNSPADIRNQWHLAELAYKRHSQSESLFTRGALPSDFGNHFCNDNLAATKTPSVHTLDVDTPYCDYGLCIKESGEKFASMRIAGKAPTMLKTNSFVSTSLLDNDSFDVMGHYGELGKAWRFACKNILSQNPIATVAVPFCCEKAATLGNSNKFRTVQCHRGTWSITEGCDQGTVHVKRTTLSMDGNILAESVNVSMRQTPDSAISSITLTTTMRIPDSDPLRQHIVNANLQDALDREDSIQSKMIIGMPSVIVTYGVIGEGSDGFDRCPIKQGIAGFVGLKHSCKVNSTDPVKEEVMAILNSEAPKINLNYVFCNEDTLKASFFGGKTVDFMVISTPTCLPVNMTVDA